MVERLEDDDNDVDLQNEVPEEGCEVQTRIDVLHDVVVVDFDLQDEKVVHGHFRIEEQDVQVEDEDVDKV